MEYEEPLAEFGALVYMNNYYHVTRENNNAMWGLYSLVKSKTHEDIKCYSFGANLFERAKTDEYVLRVTDYYKDHDISKMNIRKALEELIFPLNPLVTHP